MQLFVKDLTVIDSSWLCEKRGMVGQSWIVDVVLDGGLDQQSMLLDFGQVKKRIKAIIDEEVDHKLLVPMQSEMVQISEGDHDMLWMDFLRPQGSYHMYVPQQALALLPAAAINIASVTEYLTQRVLSYLPNNIHGLTLQLREELINSPSYHYTHGLKKHDGNCQRIAHGHRSMLEIWVDGERSEALEQQWAERWQDIYLGTVEDLIPPEQLNLTQHGKAISAASHTAFSYVSAQGLFQLAVPKAQCELLDTDTTVECLAHYLFDTIKAALQPAQHLKVAAYEGVGKGAMVEDER